MINLGFTGGSGSGSGLVYKGTWDALTNNPFLQSSVGTDGDYYIVSVAGTTNLNGINVWNVGDWAIFNGGTWQKIDNSVTGGTVTSVGASGGTGISISGTNPITTSGIFTITNTAPDQVVSITDGTGISTTGTYPNFTITNTSPSSGGTVTSVELTSGTGISLSGTNPITSSGIINITNSAPDQLVSLTDGTGISTSGTYPNFTITNSAPDQTVSLTDGTGISVTGSYPSFTITNTQPSSGGTVTSVGLTMPSAFSVANSPITGSGSLNVTATGTSAQVILGDGTLGTLPVTTGFVPYTGATANVDLGTYNLTADHIALNVSPSGAGFVVGATEWNNSYGTSETLLKGGNVILKNGVDLVARVVNNTGINLTQAAYQVVKVAGAQGQRLAVDLAQANNDLNSADTLGIVAENINNNLEGFILTVGQLLEINTTGSLQGETWADGDVLYLSPTIAGAITNIKPIATVGHLVVLGYVEYAHSQHGKIYVKIMNGWELDELHDVYINSPANNNLLTYVTPANLWENRTLGQVIGGITSQYVRGDGSVATFPTSTGGGSSVAYYLNGGTSQGTIGGNPYYQMSRNAVIGSGVDFSLTNTTGYIAEFITDISDPSLLSIPLGAWNFSLYFSSSNNTGNPSFYIELYKYNGATFTLIGSNSTSPEIISNGTAIDLYTTSIAVPLTTLTITDRLAVRVFVNTNGNRTITLHTEDNHLCEIITTFSTGLNAINGLTNQVQYLSTGTSGTDFAINSTSDTHTFNLPVASSTKTGKLSSTDWSTFNGKVNTTRSISTSSPLSGGGDLSADRTLSIADAAADGTTKGAATFTASDFNSTSGVISIDYTNGQSASNTNKGFLTSADWSTFNGKVNTSLTISTTSPLSGGGDLSANRTLSISDAAADGTTKGAATFTASDFNSASGVISIDYTNGQAASASNKGFLTSTDFTTFNGKQNAITLTTTGTTGASTLVGSTLNIPQYAGGLVNFTEAQNTTSPNNTVYVDSLSAISAVTNTDFAIIPKGTGALLAAVPDGTATGGNKRGNNAIDLQMVRTANTMVASGNNAIIIGSGSTASGSSSSVIGRSNSNASPDSTAVGSLNAITGAGNIGSVAIGYNNSVSVNGGVALGSSNTASTTSTGYAVAVGQSNTASGTNASSIGYSNTASGNQSVALGYQNTSSGRASVVHGSWGSSFSVYERFVHSTFGYVAGDSQKSVFLLSARTTNNTATTLTASFSQVPTPSATNQVTLQNNNSFRFKGSIIARQSGSTNTSAWDIDGIIQRGTTAASTTLLISNVTLVQNTPAWGMPTLAADTTLGCLRVQVTGVATTNIQWTCSIETTEVIYA